MVNKYFTIDILKETYDKLPNRIQLTLNIHEEGTEVSGWKQFKSRYYSRRLAFEPTEEGAEAARSRFAELFFDNEFLLKQIAHAKQLSADLADFSNWKLVTTSVGVGSTKSTGNSMTASSGEDKAGDKAESLNKNLISDSNSYGSAFVGQVPLTTSLDIYTGKPDALIKSESVHYPVNAVNESGTTTQGNRKTDTKGVSASLNTNLSNYDNVNKTESSNTAEDYNRFLHLEIPQLRNRFWNKFAVLFHYC